MNKNEIWRDIPGYEGYQVSNHGRIKRLSRCVKYIDGRKRVNIRNSMYIV
jgi:hypothetical protein